MANEMAEYELTTISLNDKIHSKEILEQEARCNKIYKNRRRNYVEKKGY